MIESAAFSLKGRNPDILTSISNLSNDEVFTPPWLVNRMLDQLEKAWANSNQGSNLWADPALRFLDPFTKSGVFLREITKRLITGLEEEIPNLEQRVDHILTQQIFGMGITKLTALMARRSLYCSKWANGQHSIARSFSKSEGNIWFEPTEHTWARRKCVYCGASQDTLEREEELETHAYALIHSDDVQALLKEVFGADMQFDVIIGNPPYQLDDGGYGTSAAPIYDKFVEQAKRLDPRFLAMIIPARWYSGGKGLDEFRASMLSDNRVRSIDDFLSAADVFPGIGLKGGVCYFLWDRDNPGPCKVTTHFKDEEPSSMERPLLESGLGVFVRFNEGIAILRKVVNSETGQGLQLSLPEDRRFETLVSSRKPFALDTTFKGKASRAEGDLKVYRNGGIGYVARTDVTVGLEYVDAWKVYVGRAAPGTGNRDTYPHRIISTPFIGEPGSICSETYLCIGPLANEKEAESVLSYLSCRLTRLLILLHKPSQDTTRRVYTFVPTQKWNKEWTDADLYKKYGVTSDEVAFIETLVRPMDLADG